MKLKLLLATLAVAFSLSATAANITPSFDGAPAGWTVDRYAPDSFADIGTYQGRSDVLSIGIGSNGNSANRAGTGQQATFYNTQGMAHAVTGGTGDSLAAALYVPASWLDSSLGARRTDLWGVITDGTNVTDYPIIGFTNAGSGGFVGFRTWNVVTDDWDNLAAPVNTNGWNDLSIVFTGSSYQYFVNGVLADSTASSSDSTTFSSVLMQAYNFADPALGSGYVANAYSANWSASPVPLPAALPLLLSGIAGVGAFVRRKRLAAAA